MSRANDSLNKHVQNRDYCKSFTGCKIIEIVMYLQLSVINETWITQTIEGTALGALEIYVSESETSNYYTANYLMREKWFKDE